MSVKQFRKNNQANESISKYKLLSTYGGPGSIVHTQYGSIMISCIEEWGFLKKIVEIDAEARQSPRTEKEVYDYVNEQAKLQRNGGISLSNDNRLLRKLIERKGLSADNFKYLVLIPNIELKEFSNEISASVDLSISSSYMPKTFADKANVHLSYNSWYEEWVKVNQSDDPHGTQFFPPKKNWDKNENGEVVKRRWIEILTQSNIVLICNHGHISDFPWSQYLRWKNENPKTNSDDKPVDLFNMQFCCGTYDNPTAKIVITSNAANSSGFDGKILKCINTGCGSKPISLQGLMSVKCKCQGHKPWESSTNDDRRFPYSGSRSARRANPLTENCNSSNAMKVALTTGNNLYYSRIMSSIFIPNVLFEDERDSELRKLEKELAEGIKNSDFAKCVEINELIQNIKNQQEPKAQVDVPDSEKDVQFKFQEFKAFCNKSPAEINIEERFLKVSDVTQNLISKEYNLQKYFTRILRIDNMKITSAQLDFSRVEPADGDANPEELALKNIFKIRPEKVQVYPVVESYGEGIFFAFSTAELEDFGAKYSEFIEKWVLKLRSIGSDNFSANAVEYGRTHNWQLFLVHTFSHLLMRELEFRCGYPTSSISERIYVSNEEKYKMYGCMIYTAEGAEGSMGGLIAQTKGENLIYLILSAMKRATICHSDPLCWESDGQGLFDLNFGSCFSCSLVSETSCELRNIYLDRRILVDEDFGFFKALNHD